MIYLGLYCKIQKLYDLGARKFGILNVPPIGCYPAVTCNNGGKCVKPLNDFAVAFNKATQTLLQKLSFELEEFEYSLANTYAMFNTMLKYPLAFGKHNNNSIYLFSISITKLISYIFLNLIVLYFHSNF